jgi:hypothetical protein
VWESTLLLAPDDSLLSEWRGAGAMSLSVAGSCSARARASLSSEFSPSSRSVMPPTGASIVASVRRAQTSFQLGCPTVRTEPSKHEPETLGQALILTLEEENRNPGGSESLGNSAALPQVGKCSRCLQDWRA